MKKFLMIAVMAVAAISANAQKFYVGGQVEVNAVVDGETTFAILPEIGYNISDKWAIGTEIGYEKKSDLLKGFSLNPYARYTFAKCGSVNFFADGQLGVFIPSEGDTAVGLGIEPGIAINVCKSMFLVAKTNLLSWSHRGDTNVISFLGKTTELSFGAYFKF